jgi:L-cystine transport system permease protein
VERGQFEAGYSIGLTKAQTLKRIILPQALPVAVPMLGNGLIGLVKGSSLAFLMAVTDLLNAALIPANANYRFLEAYIAAGIVYWVICLSIERLSAVIEKKLGYFVRKAIV